MVEYLIIGGATKCATTSLFTYLGQHPSICPSSFKETRFFLNPKYPLKRKTPVSSNLSDYQIFFKNCSANAIKMEATPDYLYSEKTEYEIKKLLKNCQLIFILRNPIDRLKSWYKFSKQMNLLDKDVSFEHYINLMKSDTTQKFQHLMAMEQGKYSTYLNKYISCFGKENIHIIIYEELVNNTYKTISSLCKKLNISSDFYTNYSFDNHNKTVEVKNKSIHSIFLTLRRTARKHINKLPLKIKMNLKKTGASLVSNYWSMNTESDLPVFIKDETKIVLTDYYLSSNKELEKLINTSLNWNK